MMTPFLGRRPDPSKDWHFAAGSRRFFAFYDVFVFFHGHRKQIFIFKNSL